MPGKRRIWPLIGESRASSAGGSAKPAAAPPVARTARSAGDGLARGQARRAAVEGKERRPRPPPAGGVEGTVQGRRASATGRGASPPRSADARRRAPSGPATAPAPRRPSGSSKWAPVSASRASPPSCSASSAREPERAASVQRRAEDAARSGQASRPWRSRSKWPCDRGSSAASIARRQHAGGDARGVGPRGAGIGEQHARRRARASASAATEPTAPAPATTMRMPAHPGHGANHPLRRFKSSGMEDQAARSSP